MTILKLKIKILALGKIKEKYLRSGIDEFLKRLKPYAQINVVEITPIEIKDENLKDKILLQEGEKILSNIKPTDFVITMEIRGKEFSSEEFAAKIEELTNSGTQSKMTFLHEFARLILIEQLYRSFKIIKGEIYHK